MNIKRISALLLVLFTAILLVACKRTKKPTAEIDEMNITRTSMTMVFTIKDPDNVANLHTVEGKLTYKDEALINTYQAELVEDTESTFKIIATNLSINHEYTMKVTVIAEKRIMTLFSETFRTKHEGSSSENPIYIETTQQFLNLEADDNAYYKLMNDLDFSDVIFTPLFQSRAFSGNFDGNGKTIKNIVIDKRSTYVSIFGRNSGTIKNLTLDNIDISLLASSQSSQYIGVLTSRNSGVIENVTITNSKIRTNFSHSGTIRIGGVSAYSESGSKVVDSHAEMTFAIEAISRSEFYIGGLVGELNGATMTGSSAVTNIEITNTTTAYIGGAVGHMVNSSLNDSIVKESEADLNININTTVDRVVANAKEVAISIGGFVGKMLQSSITDAYAKAHIVYPRAHNTAANQSLNDKIALGGFAGSVANRSKLENVLADANISLGSFYEPEVIEVVEVKFELGYNKERLDAVNLEVGEKVAEPEAPEREGYNFLGWYLGNSPYDFNSPVNNTINIVAQWEKVDPEATPDKLVVILYRGYGNLYLNEMEVVKGGKINTPSTPSRDGYEFIGWYLDGELFDFETPIEASLALLAGWRKVSLDRFELLYIGGIAGESFASSHIKNYARDPQINLYTEKGKYLVNGTVGYDSLIGNYSGGSIKVNETDYTHKHYQLLEGDVTTIETIETSITDFFTSEYILEILNRE